ncbi:DnaJ C-terminal domain-containing protein [Pelagicoccus sp. SDUM812003]|uniref:DnaJ C-terminal domain-containing protein n=1 Tax=Pelagicoccus sp. SDUM812003 TaxID=3041267 RepID=UPI00280C8A44|nr:DnaJ C-terminal domain-containing protein [Pelagicoccus sp. SDUM812003]MDQ8202617.1 DnaJ C-terminal domain-containing protein [Pelagicoccus sp. SDUM812003]
MSVAFKDYYSILGVAKTASAEEIKKAFRKLARECHPDLAKEADKASAEARFKEINEAYEVLKDPKKRAKYDQLGADWNRYQDNGDADAGPGFGAGSGGRRYEYHFGGTGFSDFFERFFGGRGMDPFEDMGFGMRGADFSRGETGRRRVRGQDVEAEILVTLEEANKGSRRRISLRKQKTDTGKSEIETLNVRIPAGVRDGQRIRLAGQGEPSPAGGEAGDLFLKVRFAQHPYFSIEGDDLIYELKLAPWEAALGAEVTVPTLGGSAKVRVKSGAQNGQRLRLRGHGLARSGGGTGDLYAEIALRMPDRISEEEKRVWQKLRDTSRFNPRG